jgi:hypothetical protein
MTTEEFFELWADTELRQYIVDQAKRHSRYKENQEDYVQEAWLRLSLCDGGCCNEYYKQQAYNGIQNAYKRARRKLQYDLEDIEVMSRDIYEAWQHGTLKNW